MLVNYWCADIFLISQKSMVKIVFNVNFTRNYQIFKLLKTFYYENVRVAYSWLSIAVKFFVSQKVFISKCCSSLPSTNKKYLQCSNITIHPITYGCYKHKHGEPRGQVTNCSTTKIYQGKSVAEIFRVLSQLNQGT